MRLARLITYLTLTQCCSCVSPPTTRLELEYPTSWPAVSSKRLDGSDCPDLRGLYEIGGKAADGTSGQGTPFRAHPSHPRLAIPGVMVRVEQNDGSEKIGSFELMQPGVNEFIIEADSVDHTFRSRVNYDSTLGDFTCTNGKLIRADKATTIAVGSSAGQSQTVSELSALEDGSIMIRINSHYTGSGLFDRRDERKQWFYRYFPLIITKQR